MNTNLDNLAKSPEPRHSSPSLFRDSRTTSQRHSREGGSPEPLKTLDSRLHKNNKKPHSVRLYKNINLHPLIKKNTSTLLTLIAITLFCIAYYPVFQTLISKWAHSPDYNHAFLMIPAIAYMVWWKRDFFLESEDGGYFGLGCVLLSSVLYIISLRLQIPTISALITLMTITSAFIYMAGIRVLKVLTIAFFLMLLLIPIPNQLYSTITLPLQLMVSQVSGLLLQQFNIPVLREGNVLTIPGKIFEVVEACSGIRSLMALLSLSLILGYFTLRKNLSILLLLAASLPIAIAVNIIRVVSLVLAYHIYELDMSKGSAHTLSGLALFWIALTLLYMLQRILESWETK